MRSQGSTILVVDDEPEIRDLLRDCLAGHGYAVIPAGNASEATGILAARPDIGLVITDVVMPGGTNGFQLGRAARAAQPSLSILYMSGYAVGQTMASMPSRI